MYRRRKTEKKGGKAFGQSAERSVSHGPMGVEGRFFLVCEGQTVSAAVGRPRVLATVTARCCESHFGPPYPGEVEGTQRKEEGKEGRMLTDAAGKGDDRVRYRIWERCRQCK